MTDVARELAALRREVLALRQDLADLAASFRQSSTPTTGAPPRRPRKEPRRPHGSMTAEAMTRMGDGEEWTIKRLRAATGWTYDQTRRLLDNLYRRGRIARTQEGVPGKPGAGGVAAKYRKEGDE